MKQAAVASAISRVLRGRVPTISLGPLDAGAQITRHHFDFHEGWNAALGVPIGPITFGFRDTPPSYTDPSQHVELSFSKFNAAQIAAATLALQLWSDVANISFVRVGAGYTDNATILFGNYNNPSGASGIGYIPSPGNIVGHTA
jgi:serralysin